MKTGTVYGLRCPVENRIIYVGQTVRPLQERLRRHRNSIKKQSRKSALVMWLRSMSVKGLIDRVVIEPLKEHVEENMLIAHEAFFIHKIGETSRLLNVQDNFFSPYNSEYTDIDFLKEMNRVSTSAYMQAKK